MGFFGKLFGGSQDNYDKNTKNTKSSETSGIPYDKGLISQLIKDHKQLVEEFTKISKFAKSRKYKALKQSLKTFKLNFEIHNYSEKVQLYTYLNNYYKGTQEERFINEMAMSAEKIYKDVLAFLKRYEAIDFNDKYLEQFLQELSAIGKVLQSRIETEEKDFYILYKP
ncbi:MAG: sigma D regulator [Epsilonproteobacteria bacterium]|nr:sigma D regulator [Campylobacterota bacterium]